MFIRLAASNTVPVAVSVAYPTKYGFISGDINQPQTYFSSGGFPMVAVGLMSPISLLTFVNAR